MTTSISTTDFDRVESRSPQAPHDVLVNVAATPTDAVRHSAARSRTAQREWVGIGALARSAALSLAADTVAAAADELTALVVREVGKPVGESAGEVARGVAILRYYAQQALDPDGVTLPALDQRTLMLSRKRPQGLAGLITPWNFPLAIPLWKAAPALAFGNGVLLKPSPDATACSLRLAELLAGALPQGLFAVVTGHAETGAALIEVSDVVSFTGSGSVGRSVAIAAARAGRPVQAEMGGLNASIVAADADLAVAAHQISLAAMGYAGQKCTATSRVITVGRGRELTEALRSAVEGLVVGDPADPATTVGPVIRASSVDAVVAAAGEAERLGGQIATGGVALGREGHFVAPTIVTAVPEKARVVTEEVFGPICALIEVDSIESAITVNNSVRYGLVTSLYSADINTALEAVDKLDTGMVRVNASTTGLDFWAPFGGDKDSSQGPREQGKAARDFYTTTQTTTVSACVRS
jgi:alpha-ketoglutaric semialdehyde dehydrogenase